MEYFRISFDDGYIILNILKLLYFKWVNYMVCELCFNEVIMKNRLGKEEGGMWGENDSVFL